MKSPALEIIAQSINYGDLPEIWRVPEIEQFSTDKTLYDYQVDALKKVACSLYLYYSVSNNQNQEIRSDDSDVERKFAFSSRYEASSINCLTVKQYENNVDRRDSKQNEIFRILSEYIRPQGDEISYQHQINRMCFWMATGSGKTLVMVKLIEFLHRLQQNGCIPKRNILILAPSDHLLKQVHQTVEEFNQQGLLIQLISLREIGNIHQGSIWDSVTVYYHRSDNISELQREALIDFRRYENDGKWYVLLDEAHKGSKEDSKRQAYYSVMARSGFLFNFSATFIGPEDIATTVKKYNLEEFILNGHGKHIYLNEDQFTSFRSGSIEINHAQRRVIVLKSLIALALVTKEVDVLRRGTGLPLYHLPLMLTLVSSVNTDIENENNDLWAFFQTLREVASGEIDASAFNLVKQELLTEWQSSSLLFGSTGETVVGELKQTELAKLTIPELREHVFLSRSRSALQIIRGRDPKELAFQMKNASTPFALIRIGDTSKWRSRLLVGYEETETLRDTSFFDSLEQSNITILMGSRSFFESWDSNRPNVINFINIGGIDAKKFVVQSVGRGVRIEPFPGQRRRFVYLPDTTERQAIQPFSNHVSLPETLFVFSTNKKAIQSVLEGLQAEKIGVFETVGEFKLNAKPLVNGQEIPLLFPDYKEFSKGVDLQAKFAMDDDTLQRFRQWLDSTSDSVLIVRDNLTIRDIDKLRRIGKGEGVHIIEGKSYTSLRFLQSRLLAHFNLWLKDVDSIRELDTTEDIVHFRQIRAQLDSDEMNRLRQKIRIVKQGELPVENQRQIARDFAAGLISSEEFSSLINARSVETFKSLTIKNIASHYYVPIVMATKHKSEFIQHVINEESEIQFIQAMEQWLEVNTPDWDAWMFSKIDESVDSVHVPYFDTSLNEYRRFLPDFVFWMLAGNKYQIVFVDPKGTEHASTYRKIDGFRQIFEYLKKPKEFEFQDLVVVVKLLMFNRTESVPNAYSMYWTNDVAEIFESI